MLKEGDRVTLREDSNYWGQSEGTEGSIIEIYEDDDHHYRVEWDCGLIDAYREQDVNVVPQTWKQRLTK